MYLILVLGRLVTYKGGGVLKADEALLTPTRTPRLLHLLDSASGRSSHES
jgi:hypothetical protein